MTYLLGQADALDRLEGAGRLSGGAWDSVWLWVLLAALLAVVAGLVVGGLVMRARAKREAMWKRFRAAASEAGLNAKEMRLVGRIAAHSGLKLPEMILTLQAPFEHGAARLLKSAMFSARTPGEQDTVRNLVDSAREKLGFGPLDGQESRIASSREIPKEARLSIIRRGSAHPLGASVALKTPDQLVVAMLEDARIIPGETWMVRYSNHGAVCEFQTQVLEFANGRAAVRHADHVRFVNRRRFQRVATWKPALVAAWGFRRSGKLKAPAFAKANVVEIAGPGLLVEADLGVEPGARVLAAVQLDAEHIVQAVATVRRATHRPETTSILAVEMTGLRSAELDVLAKATLDAAREGQAVPEHDEQEVHA